MGLTIWKENFSTIEAKSSFPPWLIEMLQVPIFLNKTEVANAAQVLGDNDLKEISDVVFGEETSKSIALSFIETEPGFL